MNAQNENENLRWSFCLSEFLLRVKKYIFIFFSVLYFIDACWLCRFDYPSKNGAEKTSSFQQQPSSPSTECSEYPTLPKIRSICWSSNLEFDYVDESWWRKTKNEWRRTNSGIFLIVVKLKESALLRIWGYLGS